MILKSYFRCGACKKHWTRRGTIKEASCHQCKSTITAYKCVPTNKAELKLLRELEYLAVAVANVALAEDCK